MTTPSPSASWARAWSQGYFARLGLVPEMTQAGTYAGGLHYHKAVQAAGTKDGPSVAVAGREPWAVRPAEAGQRTARRSGVFRSRGASVR